MTPDERQAATLAELDRLELVGIEAVEHLLDGGSNGLEKTDGPYTPAHVYMFNWAPVRTGAIISALRSTLVRHAPECVKVNGEWMWRCPHDGYAWEQCPDWRDAAAGLEVPDA